MTISLEASDRNAIILALTKATQVAAVSRHVGILAKSKDWLDELTDQLSPQIRRYFDKYLDDTGITGFVRSSFLHRLFTEGDEIPATTQKLTKYKSFSDPLSVAMALCDSIESLPWQYRIIIRGSASMALQLKGTSFAIKLSDRLSLVSFDNLPNDMPLANDNVPLDKWIRSRSSSSSHPSELDEDGIYFIYRTSGFVDERLNSKFVREASDEIRAFYGACLALGYLYDDFYGFGFEHDEDASVIFVHRLADPTELISLEAADTDLQRATQLDTSLEFDRALKGGKTIEEILSPIQSVNSSEESARLNTASVWLLRTQLSATDIDRVLEATITIEVLLGDRDASDRVGLSKLMANRCAYALGRTQDERKTMIDFFVKFYKVRSDIVHSGKFRPSDIEKGVVEKGVALASRILRHEIAIVAPA